MMVYNVFINILSVTGKLSVWTVLMNLKLSAALLVQLICSLVLVV